MYQETIGHGTVVYTLQVERSGAAVVSAGERAWGVPAGQTFAGNGMPREVAERINRRIADGREVLGVGAVIADEQTVV